jgi:deoxyribodipyrimidine photo-lyase
MKRALVIFRRDLRISDNTALLEAAREAEEVIPAFILDPLLLDRWQEATWRMAFLFQSLDALQRSITERSGTLIIQRGDYTQTVERLIERERIDGVYVNREYTPFGVRRDDAVSDACKRHGIPFRQFADALLNEPDAVTKGNGTPYSVFTPYYNLAKTHFVPSPDIDTPIRFGSTSTESERLPEELLGMTIPDLIAGTAGAGNVLDRISELYDYGDARDIPATERTSRLSAHLRFGTCSIREAWHAIANTLGEDSPLLRQLYWRDFYTQIAFNFPHVYRHAFRRQYDNVPWEDDKDRLALWQQGRTGFPIVDAGMRELATTGYMHNRVRMIVASFLTKNLHIDWREGEKHFARYLIDYDPAVNNGNWQWGASTGCDAQPYFRIFNPWRQQEKFDKDCTYIKKWVPELAPFPAKAIHKLEKEGDFYLPQITDLRSSAEESKLRFKLASKKGGLI